MGKIEGYYSMAAMGAAFSGRHKARGDQELGDEVPGPILIHAAKANHVYDILGFSGEPYPRRYFDEAGITKERNLVFGAIIGKAILVDCKLIDEGYREFIETLCPAEFAFGDFTVGRYAWRLEQPVLFKKPIPAAGKQRLWEYNGKLEEVPHGKAEKQ